MLEFHRIGLVALAGISLAIFIGLLSLPNEAEAPADPVPFPLIQEVATTTPAEPEVDVTPAESEVKTEVEVPVPAPKTEIKPEPKIETVVETITKTLTQPVATSSAPITTNDRVREALVNIICTTGSGLNSISASGVVVDPRGIIMTNAHVAQYFLLENYPSQGAVECIARTGSPAYPRYEVELLFLPPTWIQKNAQKIDDETPTGNGEHDYALLRVTGPVGNNTLPNSLPYLPLLSDEVNQGADVLIAGYPAGFLGGITIAKELYAASSPAKIGQVYTYEGATIDLYSIGGSVVAQQGSSGGAVADASGNLIGLIVTSTQAAETSQRDLRAISMSYVFRDFARERGVTLSEYLKLNLVNESQLFKIGTMPTLTQTLVNVLNQ